MKTCKPLFAFAASLALAANLYALSDQTIKLSVIYNSNLPSQGDLTEFIGFNSNGSNGSDLGDLGNASSIQNPGDNVYPFSITTDGNVVTEYDNHPQVDRYMTIQVGFLTKNAATISVTVPFDHIDPSSGITNIYLQQLSTGIAYRVLGDTASFVIPANENFQADFILMIGHGTSKQVLDETCYYAGNGEITVSNLYCSNWRLDVYANSALLFSSNIHQQDTTFTGLVSGAYFCAAYVGNMLLDSVKVIVGGPASLNPYFTADTITPGVYDLVNFTGDTTGVVAIAWDFGDGNTDTGATTSHAYLNDGTYIVTMTVTGPAGCQESTTDTIFVSPLPSLHNFHAVAPGRSTTVTGAETAMRHEQTTASISGAQNRISVRTNEADVVSVVDILAMNGQLISSNQFSGNAMEFAVPQTGIYIVILHFSDGTFRSEKMMIND